MHEPFRHNTGWLDVQSVLSLHIHSDGRSRVHLTHGVAVPLDVADTHRLTRLLETRLTSEARLAS